MPYCCALLPSNLTTRWVLLGVFCSISETLCYCLFSDFLFLCFLFHGRKRDANLKRMLHAHLEINCLESVCALIKKIFTSSLVFWTGLFIRESEEIDIPSDMQNKPNTQTLCVPKAHIIFPTCKLRNLLEIIYVFMKSQSLSM